MRNLTEDEVIIVSGGLTERPHDLVEQPHVFEPIQMLPTDELKVG